MTGEQTSLDFLERSEESTTIAAARARRSGAFTDNMALPLHRWFRYSAGFSSEWVESLVKTAMLSATDVVFDPFVGSGTTLLAAQRCGVASAGAESHPFVARIAHAKLAWNVNNFKLIEAGEDLLKKAKLLLNKPVGRVGLLEKCYTPETLARLEALRSAYLETIWKDEGISELVWLAITAILRECSGVGTAQWQYILPAKTKAKVSDPFVAFIARLRMFSVDISGLQLLLSEPAKAEIHQADSRDLSRFSSLHGRVGLVVTSPPYPNNYDYADATRLEMTFWGEVSGWGDLQHVVRRHLIRSCSQHSAAERLHLPDLLSDKSIGVIFSELSAACLELQAVRETKGGKKTYHTMVAAYFIDLAKTLQEIYPLCRKGADLCFVIGDSAPYGVYIPVDEWLTQLAVSSGFQFIRFDKIRDRNLKWKNRKHRVPLQEGNLWLRKKLS